MLARQLHVPITKPLGEVASVICFGNSHRNISLFDRLLPLCLLLADGHRILVGDQFLTE